MDPLNSPVEMGPGMYAMKKAIETQGQAVMKVLESAQTPETSSTPGLSASVTGIGQNLDIRG